MHKIISIPMEDESKFFFREDMQEMVVVYFDFESKKQHNLKYTRDFLLDLFV